MAKKSLIKIGNYSLPNPTSYSGQTATIVDSARNVKGYVIGAVIRSDVGKVEADWNYLTAEEWSTILKLFTPTFGGKFYNQVTFYDQVRADWVTKKMYVGDRTNGGAFQINHKTGEVIGWKNPHLSLVEV